MAIANCLDTKKHDVISRTTYTLKSYKFVRLGYKGKRKQTTRRISVFIV